MADERITIMVPVHAKALIWLSVLTPIPWVAWQLQKAAMACMVVKRGQ